MTEHYTDKGHLLIRNSDIKDGYFEFGENPIYLDEEFSEQNKSRMHQLGDVITVHTGDIGTSAVIGENEVNSIGFATIVTRPNQEILDSNYFATYLNTDTHKQWAVSMATGDGRSNYNLKDYTKLVVPIPEIEEQKKIAACIVNINSLITLHQRKCDEVKSLKKYMLQKMFPQNEQKVPEIRFEGFTEAWEQRKVDKVMSCITDYVAAGSFADIRNNVTYLAQDGYAQLVRTVDLKNKFNNHDFVYVGENAFEYLWRVNLNEECIVLPNIGANIGEVYYIKPSDLPEEHNVLGPNAILLKTKEDNYFVFTALNTDRFQSQLFENVGSSGQPKFNKTELKTINLIIPKYEEQKKIGAYFSNLDHLITLHQQKCEELKKIKKFMLQKMFV